MRKVIFKVVHLGLEVAPSCRMRPFSTAAGIQKERLQAGYMDVQYVLCTQLFLWSSSYCTEMQLWLFRHNLQNTATLYGGA